MAVNPASWGALGNPTPEKIREYTNMPVGDFRKLVARINRTKKGKKMSEYTVYVTKRDVTMTRGVITTSAFDFSEAADYARMNRDKIAWDAEPYKTNYEEYVHSNMDPLKYKT